MTELQEMIHAQCALERAAQDARADAKRFSDLAKKRGAEAEYLAERSASFLRVVNTRIDAEAAE
jgi:hypothetical protein